MIYTIECYKVRKNPLHIIGLSDNGSETYYTFDDKYEAMEFCRILRDSGYKYSFEFMIPSEIVRLFTGKEESEC